MTQKSTLPELPDNRPCPAEAPADDDRRPFVIPFFIPHQGCPHRCVFCNQNAISQGPAHLPSSADIREQVRRYLGYRGKRRGRSQVAFFGGNFLGLAARDAVALLRAADRLVVEGLVDGIRFSTRPDTVDSQRLDLLSRYGVTTVELGVQSMDDRVLQLSQRGHDAADTAAAVRRLRERGYEVGCQMMVGLPGDCADRTLAGARRLASLAPDFVRIYPTVVLAGSRLADWYRAGRYTPMALEACVDLVKCLYQLFNDRGIRVVRMGLQANADLGRADTVLAGPYHPAFGHLVYARLFLEKAVSGIRALAPCGDPPPATVTLCVNPRDEARLRGLNAGNVAFLKQLFPETDLRILCDEAVERGGLRFSRSA